MIRKLFFVLTILFFTSVHSYSQESCSCSSTAGGCSASQSCPAGKSAVCSCSLTGCSSSCQSGGEVLPELEGTAKLETAPTREIGSILSSISGMNVRFVPATKNFRLSEAKGLKNSLWDRLEVLSQNGELTINGHKLDFWKSQKTTLLEGGEFKICSGGASAQRILNMLSFISGKNHVITSGDAYSKITGQIEGNNLNELLESLQKISGITVAQTR